MKSIQPDDNGYAAQAEEMLWLVKKIYIKRLYENVRSDLGGEVVVLFAYGQVVRVKHIPYSAST